MMAYCESTEQIMRQYFNTLSEKDKRRYAAVEAHKLGEGGISYIARVLGCARNTIYQGLSELAELPEQRLAEGRIRRGGGGRKVSEQTIAQLEVAFLEVIKDHMAGDPMDEQVRWTNLSQTEIKQRLAQQHQIQVSETVIKRLLRKHNFRRRKAQKNEQ
jgi:hypothetical protein